MFTRPPPPGLFLNGKSLTIQAGLNALLLQMHILGNIFTSFGFLFVCQLFNPFICFYGNGLCHDTVHMRPCFHHYWRWRASCLSLRLSKYTQI